MHCGYCSYRHSTCERREDKKRIWKTGLHTRMQGKTHRKKNGEGYLSSTQFSPPPPLGSFGGRQALKTRACSGSLKSRFQVKDPEKINFSKMEYHSKLISSKNNALFIHLCCCVLLSWTFVAIVELGKETKKKSPSSKANNLHNFTHLLPWGHSEQSTQTWWLHHHSSGPQQSPAKKTSDMGSSQNTNHALPADLGFLSLQGSSSHPVHIVQQLCTTWPVVCIFKKNIVF